MSGQELAILFYSALAGIATLVGILVMERKQHLALKYSHYVNSFAAGLILALAFFHLVPEAGELGGQSGFIAIFFGFFLFFILENMFIMHSGAEIHFCIDQDEEELPSDHPKKHLQNTRLGLMAFTGLAFHSLIDGIIIGLGFEIDPVIGLLAATAVIAHELPEGITSFALMRMGGMDLKASRYLSVVIALATPLGAILALLFLQSITESIVGVLLGLAAGTFIYVAASDLIPETHESNNRRNLLAFFAGSIFILLITMIFAG